MNSIELPPAADFHVHLRDGSMMETVVPTIRKGGVSLVYVMVGAISPPFPRLCIVPTFSAAKPRSAHYYHRASFILSL